MSDLTMRGRAFARKLGDPRDHKRRMMIDLCDRVDELEVLVDALTEAPPFEDLMPDGDSGICPKCLDMEPCEDEECPLK